MKRILIIGSEGFIGSSVARVLRETFDIQRADIVYGVEGANYRQIDPDVPDFAQLLDVTKPEVVVNCSGAASVPLSFEDPARDFRLNTLRVHEILEAIRISLPSARFVHLSSAAVYGNPKTLPVREEASPAPVSPYGWHKFYAEQICREYALLFNLQSISLRIFSCYGPRLRKQLFWDSYQKALKSKTPQFFGSGEEARDFIYVDDLARAIQLVIEKADFDGRAINAASGTMTTIREAVETLLRHLGDQYEANFTGQVRRGDPDRWVADISYLERLGFSPAFDVKMGLERTAEWLNASN